MGPLLGNSVESLQNLGFEQDWSRYSPLVPIVTPSSGVVLRRGPRRSGFCCSGLPLWGFGADTPARHSLCSPFHPLGNSTPECCWRTTWTNHVASRVPAPPLIYIRPLISGPRWIRTISCTIRVIVVVNSLVN